VIGRNRPDRPRQSPLIEAPSSLAQYSAGEHNGKPQTIDVADSFTGEAFEGDRARAARIVGLLGEEHGEVREVYLDFKALDEGLSD
jgi:hypothetical protein